MLNLPSSFRFGIAESDLQTVGSSDPQISEDSQVPMWETFATSKGIDTPSQGSQKYHNWQKDVELIGNTGINCYRTSISMSRTITKDGKVNLKALKWYRNYLEALRAKNIEIHLCLYHWEAPDIFASEGVLSPNFHEYFLKHTKIVLDNLGDLIDYVIPMNELWCMSYLSYYRGIHAPGKSDIDLFFQSYFQLISLQSTVIKTVKEHSPQIKIGIVNIHFPTYVLSEKINEDSYLKTRHVADHITNTIYSDPFYLGTIDESVINVFNKHFPSQYKNLIKNAICADLIDYYGINYYNSMYVKPAENDFGYELDYPSGQLTNSLGWPVSLPPHYPNGLTDILVSYTQRYSSSGLKHLMVSENGCPVFSSKSSEMANDDFRIFFINEHLKQVQEAIMKGVPVEGYFLWTLLDNYEWQEGYKPEAAFGIITVNNATGERLPKKSYYWYKDLIQKFKS